MGKEPVFPPELQISSELENQHLMLRGENVTGYRPTKLDQLLKLISDLSNTQIVVGNTEDALEIKFKHSDYPVLINPTLIAEILVIQRTVSFLSHGGTVTVKISKHPTIRRRKELDESQSRASAASHVSFHTDFFTSKVIRKPPSYLVEWHLL